MRTIIIYATKHGATKKIGEYIANRINNAVLHDIDSAATISVSDYDCVVLGSPLTAGMIRREIKNFAVNHTAELKSKRLGLFVSGLQKDGEAEYLKQNFPQELLDHAAAKAFLGGIFDPEGCGFVARKLIKAVAKIDAYTSTIDEEKINLFVQRLLC